MRPDMMEPSKQTEDHHPTLLTPEPEDPDRQLAHELEVQHNHRLSAEREMTLERALDPYPSPLPSTSHPTIIIPDDASLTTDAISRAAAHARPKGCTCPASRPPCADISYASSWPDCGHADARVVRHRCGATLSRRTGDPVLCRVRGPGGAAASRIRIAVVDALVDAPCRACVVAWRRVRRMGDGREGLSVEEEAAMEVGWGAFWERRLVEQNRLFAEAAARHGGA